MMPRFQAEGVDHGQRLLPGVDKDGRVVLLVI